MSCAGAVVALLVLAAWPAAAQSPPIVLRNPQVIGPVTPTVFDGDLRELPRAQQWRSGDPVREMNPRRTYPRAASPVARPQPNRTPALDPLFSLQAGIATAAPDRSFATPTLNIAGQGYTGALPPDTVGDVGMTYYIQMINSAGGANFVVYNKADGTVAAGPTTLDTLGTGACASGFGDPVVLYDQLAGRWMLSEFSQVANRLCVYVSKTADPIAGGWYAYQFTTPDFPDYPKYGVWPDAYYVSSNESSPAAYALDRTRMLTGATATMQRFAAPNLAGFPFQALTPSDQDGATAPPAGAPNYFMRHRDDEVHNPGSADPTRDFLEIWEFHVDFASPANSTFSGSTIPVSEFDSDLCGLSSFNCFPQPGTGTTLDPLREVIMFRLQYRNFGSYETLVGNFVTDVTGSDRGGIRWFELRKTGGGPWTLYQEGTHSPDATNRWMGSIAMDGAGDIALGYSVSSTTQYPSIRYAGRLAGDALGTLPQGEYTIANGLASQGSNRWGDYSALSVDPADDCTFWYTNEYTPTGLWATRIAAFKFDSCGGGPPPPPPPPPSTRTLTVTKAGAGGGTVTSSPAGISCGATCKANFTQGTMVALTAVADAGSYFAGFSGLPDCVDGAVVLDADVTCTATFGSGAPSPTPAPDPGGPGVVDYAPRSLDLNGDGLGDVIRYAMEAGGATSFLENGLFSHTPSRVALPSSTHQWSPGWTIKTGDFNGDGRTDLFFYNAATGAWYKGISTTAAAGPVTYTFAGGTWSPGWSVAIAELNGDGRADVFLYNTVSGQWYRCTSTGDGTGEFAYVRGLWSPNWQIHPVRLNGDALTDLFLYNVSTGRWYRATNDGAGGFAYAGGSWSAAWQVTPGDYTGDGLTDLFLYNVATGHWYLARNAGGSWAYVGGTYSPGWTARAGDFNGDGLIDLFLYSVTTGRWYESFSNGVGGWTYAAGVWSPGWQVFVTSLNGDSRADVLVYDPVGGFYYQGVNTGNGTFDYAGGNWGAGQTIVATRP